MKTPDADPRPPSELVLDEERMLRAMRKGLREALRRHKREGHSIIVWRNGRVERIPPEEIPTEDQDGEGLEEQ